MHILHCLKPFSRPKMSQAIAAVPTKRVHANPRYLDEEIYPRLTQRTLKDLTFAEVQGLVYRKRDGGHPAAAGQIAISSRGCLTTPSPTGFLSPILR